MFSIQELWCSLDLFAKHGDIDSGGARKWKVYRTIRQTTFTKDILLLVVVFRSTWAHLVSRGSVAVAVLPAH